MKKALKIVTLILAVCMTATFMFGCSLFGSIDPKDAKKNLKDADYEVELIEDEDEIEAMVEMMDIDGTVVAILSAFNEDEEGLEAILFEEKADAKDFVEDMEKDLQDQIEELEDEIADAEDAGEDELVEELEDYLEQLQEKMQVKRIGKWVVMGTEDAIDAFKG